MDDGTKHGLVIGGIGVVVLVVIYYATQGGSTGVAWASPDSASVSAVVQGQLGEEALNEKLVEANSTNATAALLHLADLNTSLKEAQLNASTDLSLASTYSDLSKAQMRHETTLAQVTGANNVAAIKAGKPSFLEDLGNFFAQAGSTLTQIFMPHPSAPSGG